jgi:drug/metabolite transporter (DMT)-like permease
MVAVARHRPRGALGQLLLTAALRFGTVASVIVMDYSGLFWATLYGWLLFETLPPRAPGWARR